MQLPIIPPLPHALKPVFDFCNAHPDIQDHLYDLSGLSFAAVNELSAYQSKISPPCSKFLQAQSIRQQTVPSLVINRTPTLAVGATSNPSSHPETPDCLSPHDAFSPRGPDSPSSRGEIISPRMAISPRHSFLHRKDGRSGSVVVCLSGKSVGKASGRKNRQNSQPVIYVPS